MDKSKYYDATRYYKCRTCGSAFRENFVIVKAEVDSQLNQLTSAPVRVHKDCGGRWNLSHHSRYCGIGDLMGIAFDEFPKEDNNGV